MNRDIDVIALGELLIDFTSGDTSQQGNPMFETCPGGAPCNVLSMLGKLGHKTAFIGKVGQDQFGSSLRELLIKLSIDTTHLIADHQAKTTLAFVHTGAGGERDFSFYRNPGADMMLRGDEIDASFISRGKLFHFGTLSMTHEGVREATKKAIQAAETGGLLRSFDPNLRAPLWASLEEAKTQMEYGCQHCDILKISDNEIVFLTGCSDYDQGAAYLQATYGIPLILLTLGKDGSRAYYKNLRVSCDGVNCQSIETTGAGDTFCGSVLSHILDWGIADLSQQQLSQMLQFANAAAAIVTTRRGAITSMPDPSEVEALVRVHYFGLAE